MSGITLNDKAVLNCIFNPLLPVEDAFLDEINEEILKDDEIETEEVVKAKEIEFKGIQAAENGQVEEAIKLFTDALNVAQRASGYNNRAQAHRLLGRDEDALNDLNKALDISKETGKSGCQALCQRGLLYRKKGETDLAKSDFVKAAHLGSKFAKQQLIELNPYAAMCNQMLNEMMTKLTQIETHENCHV